MTPLDAAVEKAAEALWLDIFPGIPFSRLLDADRLTYLGHARAVIEALGLAEEWGIHSCGRAHVMSEETAKARAATWPDSFTAEVRLVTPWETT